MQNQYTEQQIKNMVDNGTLCSVPFRTYELKQGGNHGFCCKWMEPGLRDGETLLNVNNSSIEEAWNGQEINKIRTDMLEGKQIKSCYVCYQEEKSSGASLRLQESNGWLEWEPEKFVSAVNQFNQTSTVTPSKMDLRFSTLCNSMCRMCTPNVSTNLAKETQKIIASTPAFADVVIEYDPAYTKEVDYGLEENFMADLQKNLHGVNKLFFLGGETTLMKSIPPLLQYCIDQNIAQNIDVQYSMNLTNTAPEALRLLGNFRSVQIVFSIDAYGKLNDYIRYPSHWDTVKTNLEKVLALSDPFWFVTSPVPMVYNIMHWHKLIEFWKEYPTVQVNPCDLENPSYLKINNLPKELVPLAFKSLTTSMRLTDSHLMMEKLKYMMHELNENLINEHKKLKIYTDAQDIHRNMYLYNYVPELATVLEKC
jgi:MoaA/NifB/PqqE/SkfB family radical SAM enzyme